MSQSWGKMKKLLEQEYICEELRGRVKYQLTKYRKKSIGYGEKIDIYVDGEITRRAYVNHHSEFSRADGIFGVIEFYEAFYEYQNQSIESSLSSDSAVVRLFAILDKRVGKRRLDNIAKEGLADQPDWLKVFYRLRFECCGMHFADSGIIDK